MFFYLRNIVGTFLFAIVMPSAGAAEYDYLQKISSAKTTLFRDYKMLLNLSRYEANGPGRVPVSMRFSQMGALGFVLEALSEKGINLCTAKIIEVGFGSPALLAHLQIIRKQDCSEVEQRQMKKLVGVDPKAHDDWVEAFDRQLDITLVKSSLEDFSSEQPFDVVIAVDVFKKEEECVWAPYRHSRRNADALRALTSASGVIIAVNDYNTASILEDDLAGTFATESSARLIGSLKERQTLQNDLNLGPLYGTLRVSVHSRLASRVF